MEGGREGVAYRVEKVEWGCLEGVLVPGGEEGEGVAILPPVLPPYIQEWEGREYGLLSLENSLEEREEEGREREEGGREITKEWMEEQMKRLRETVDWKRVIRTVRKLRYSGGVSTEPLHPPSTTSPWTLRQAGCSPAPPAPSCPPPASCQGGQTPSSLVYY